MTANSRFIPAFLFLASTFVLLVGCSESSVPAKKEFSDQDKQQAEEYKKQATDEWGNKARQPR